MNLNWIIFHKVMQFECNKRILVEKTTFISIFQSATVRNTLFSDWLNTSFSLSTYDRHFDVCAYFQYVTLQLFSVIFPFNWIFWIVNPWHGYEFNWFFNNFLIHFRWHCFRKQFNWFWTSKYLSSARMR